MRLFLLWAALAASVVRTLAAPCSCLMDGVAGTYTSQCMGDVSVVSCLTGQINVSLSQTPGDSVAFERATCFADGTWIGTSCDGHVYPLSGSTPFFNCPSVVITTTTTTTEAPAAPNKPCACAFSDSGAALGLDAPLSYCDSTFTQTLKCNGKIYVKSGNDLAPYDSVSCSNGIWSTSGCGGSPSPLNAASVSVQCGQAEPPMCPQLPYSQGLQYIGTEGGMQRYSCKGDELVKLTVGGAISDGSVRAKYFECNANTYRASSSNGDSWEFPTSPITDFSCRDYGKLNTACSIPYHTNSFLRDGVLRCVKGFYLKQVGIFDPSTGSVTNIQSTDMALTTARCEAGGWKIDGTTYSGVQLSNFKCFDTPVSVGTCGALSIATRNVEHTPFNSQYNCWDMQNEEMEVVTPSTSFYGTVLKCVSGAWQFTGSATVPIPAGSKVTCRPFQAAVLPSFPPSLPLIPIGKTPEGLTRWTCIDSTVTLDINYSPELGKKMPVHAAYIETNNTYYRYSSSIDGKFSSDGFPAKINGITCTDMGPKHSLCSDPYDVGGIRKGNRYECMKGFYLYSINHINAQGIENTFNADATDTKNMECKADGWKLSGTSLYGLRISAVQCYDVNQYSIDSACAPLNVTFENYKLQYDSLRKFVYCSDGERMGYTLNSVQTIGAGKKLYCGKNAAAAVEWKWSFLDGTEEAAIPLGAKMSCF